MGRSLQRFALAVGGWALASVAVDSRAASPFYMGGDVSLLPFIESRGGTFRDGGVAAPADHIMVEDGANLFRLRLFVNPNPNYSATNGAIQDLDYTIALAKRLKASGAKLLLDFHYSDSWADPGQQTKPAAWSTLSETALRTQVRDYTRQSLQAFRAAGVMPEMVQVGNETTNGMLWSTGKVSYTGSAAAQNASWASFGGLLNAAISGVRDVDATSGRHTQVALHVDGGSVQGRAQYFFNQLATVGGVSPSSYDIAGLSYYPTTTSALANLQGNMNYAATTLGRQVMILEANQPWKGTASGSGFAATAAGQRDALIALRDAVRAVPNGRGMGVVWWYPEAIQVAGTNIWQGGAISLFDDVGGNALPALDAFQLAAPTWSNNADGDWADGSKWAGGIAPDGPGQIARFGTVATSPRRVTLSSAPTLGTLRFQSDSTYTMSGPGFLTLDNGSSPARVDVLRGTHVLDVPVVAAGELEVATAWSSSLELGQELRTTATGSHLTKSGSGTLVLSTGRIESLRVDGGTVRVAPEAVGDNAAVIVGGLEIAPGAAVDLGYAMLVLTASDGTTLVRDLIAAARLTGAAGMSVGYSSSSAAWPSTYDGDAVSAGSIVVRATLSGDSNLDRVVNFGDLLALARSYGSTGTWQQGDFDYDGTVNFSDLLALARNYGQTAAISGLPGGDAFASDWALAQSVVPEPTVAGAIFAAASLHRLRRRRRFT